MVATASASNATKVTASTRPTVSERYAGVHIPPAGLVGAVGLLSASVLIRVRVEPQLLLRSTTLADRFLRLVLSASRCLVRFFSCASSSLRAASHSSRV